ncbi:MAG: class I SAM-dependent methyltransferase [Candidatus Omnitrophica bacterium]|nr:class I SAM-dependent methyltransferase [Candidatus Omnitrophota bacterium]
MVKDKWRVWDKDKKYGEVFYKRAVGKLPEMESSRAAAKYVAKLVKANYTILDVGCGAGHYLTSLDNILRAPFSYHGIDATAYYVQLAKKAFAKNVNGNLLRKSYVFETGDIFNLKLTDNYADVVMCNNVLLHLPSIEKPIRELWRVTKRFLVVRTLIGKTSFRIKQINPPEEYGRDGEPRNFHFLNIYSQEYISRLAGNLGGVKKYRLIEDKDYNPDNIGRSGDAKEKKSHNMTVIVNGMQVNNYIIQPWKFLIIEKEI